MAEENKELTQQELSEQNRIRREKLAQMQEAGKDPFQIVKYDVTHHSDEIRANFDALENKDVCIAGRLMSKRIMGKASFCNIQDRNGLMQSYVSKNDIGEEDYAAFKKYDIGDIIGIKGFVFKTKTGEISVHAKEVVLLSKSLQVLPEKFHGLKDQELRYRQRYVDLIVNQRYLYQAFQNYYRNQKVFGRKGLLRGRNSRFADHPRRCVRKTLYHTPQYTGY